MRVDRRRGVASHSRRPSPSPSPSPSVALTLVLPKVHNRILKRGSLPLNLQTVSGAECTRIWLNAHGIKCCRPCHNVIHEHEREESLAENYNTLELVLSHPQVHKFVAWNSKQVPRGKVAKSKSGSGSGWR
mmetsp:Transcript_6841/g.16351  ORF Transcript_6841/g.16351 Transcript_6841/m.16351 type:complete len:131 (+) Transcript_6841:1156-1548(+)